LTIPWLACTFWQNRGWAAIRQASLDTRHDMTPKWPDSIPDSRLTFLSSTVDQIQADTRVVGSFLSDSMDEFSDLDLVIAVEPIPYDSFVAERHRIAGSLGPLLAAFSGEHVGEP